MTCEVENRDGVVQIRGEMTIYAAAGLKDELFSAVGGDTGSCRIDLAGVSEFDTTGLQFLLMARRACAARGAELSLVNPSDSVREALALLRATGFSIASTGT
jgi:anti-anti-sigma factor